MKMTLQKFLELIEYKITEGSKYLWNCYGQNAFILDHDVNLSIIFDTVTHEVYETSYYDEFMTYKLFNQNFKEAYQQEIIDRNVTDLIEETEVTYEEFLELINDNAI